MSVIKAIAVFLCGFLSMTLCRAQLIFPGMCPEVVAMKDFNANRYLGKWYEAEKYFFVFEVGGKCITAEYTERDNGFIGVTNKQVSTFTGMQSEIKGEATLVSRSDEAKLSVRFPSVPFNVAAPYWVVDTDYDNYAVVWSCTDLGFFHTRFAWILTRERNPPIAIMEKAYMAADRNNINKAYFMRTDQKDCPEEE